MNTCVEAICFFSKINAHKFETLCFAREGTVWKSEEYSGLCLYYHVVKVDFNILECLAYDEVISLEEKKS